MSQTNLTNLVPTAREKGSATASNGRWWANLGPDGDVIVGHFSTHMITVEGDDEVVAINRGWGSQTDKCGIAKILRGADGWIPGDNYGDRDRVFNYFQLFG